MKDLLSEYIRSLTVRHLSEHTVKYHKKTIEDFLNWLQGEEVNPDTVRAYQKVLLQKKLKATTLELYLKTLKSFFQWLCRNDHTAEDVSAHLTYPRLPERMPNVLTEPEVTRVLARPDVKTAKGIRDRAILEVFYSSGIRKDELVRLNLYDFDETAQTLKIYGKGRKERIVPVGRVAIMWLKAYLDDVRRYYALDKEEGLFVSLRTGRRMSRPDVRSYQLEGVAFSPHSLRHSAATHMMRRGANIRHVQTLLGHSSIATTEVYTHLDIKDLKTMIKRVHPRGKKDRDVAE